MQINVTFVNSPLLKDTVDIHSLDELRTLLRVIEQVSDPDGATEGQTAAATWTKTIEKRFAELLKEFPVGSEIDTQGLKKHNLYYSTVLRTLRERGLVMPIHRGRFIVASIG